MNTKINKVKKLLFHNLKFEIITYVILSLFIAVFVFCVTAAISTSIIKNYIQPSLMETEVNRVSIKFQEYVNQNKMKSTEWEKYLRLRGSVV